MFTSSQNAELLCSIELPPLESHIIKPYCCLFQDLEELYLPFIPRRWSFQAGKMGGVKKNIQKLRKNAQKARVAAEKNAKEGHNSSFLHCSSSDENPSMHGAQRHQTADVFTKEPLPRMSLHQAITQWKSATPYQQSWGKECLVNITDWQQANSSPLACSGRPRIPTNLICTHEYGDSLLLKGQELRQTGASWCSG